jgi:phytoene synthase
LLAEWRALAQPDVEPLVAQTKLAWWRDEMSRLGTGAGVHPISRHLARLPGAGRTDFAPLAHAVDAVAEQATGVPLEREAELQPLAQKLLAGPLLVAASLATEPAPPATTPPVGIALAAAVEALSVADYLARALADYAHDARAGRVGFPVESLLGAGIENEDLLAVTPSARLRAFLERTRADAEMQYRSALTVLAQPPHAARRGLRVLATLGARHLAERRPPQSATPRLKDVVLAWRAARGMTAV